MSHKPKSTPMIRLRLSRREFMKLTGLAGAGLVIAWAADGAANLAAAQPGGQNGSSGRAASQNVDAWLSIGAEGVITLFTGKVEYGQGIQTGFAQLAAEELDVPFERVSVVMGQTDRVPPDSGTFGSLSTRRTGPQVRLAAAEMRQWLLELGAVQFGLSLEQLSTRDGAVIVSSNSGQSVSYTELAAGKKVGREFSGQTKLKPPDQYSVVGQSIPRVDIPPKVTGEMIYGYDARVPDMLHGKIFRPPSLGATLASVDTSAAEVMPGVVGVFQNGDFVGLTAARIEQAEAALGAIQATWNETSSDLTSETIHEALKTTRDQGRVIQAIGDVSQALNAATKRVSAVIKAPYITHAPIEPPTALVWVQPEQTEVWTSTQSPFGVQAAVARTLGLSPEQVIVYPLMPGGAFGRKTITDAAIEAARLSQAFQRPVRVNWTRQEEFQFGRFRPALLIEVEAGLNEQNELVAWQYDLYAAAYYPPGTSQPTSAGANVGAEVGEFYSQIPNVKTTFYQAVSPLPPHYWRANGGPVNVLARETVIDELAEQAGLDPVTFRAGLLRNNPRLLAVLEAAVEKAGWQPGVGWTGQGVGVAISFVNDTYIAEVAQVAVDSGP